MRLNMLDPCLPLEYPVNVYEDVLDGCQAAEYSHLASLAENENWEAAISYISDHQNLINTARLRVRPGLGEEEQSKTFLWTVLHLCVPKGVQTMYSYDLRVRPKNMPIPHLDFIFHLFCPLRFCTLN